MSGRNAQYAGEVSYSSVPPGFVYQPNGHKSPQEQPHQSYNQNQNAASYNAPPEPSQQHDPPPRPRGDRYDYYDRRESYQNRGWGNNRNYYEPPRDYSYYAELTALDYRTERCLYTYDCDKDRSNFAGILGLATIMTMITTRVLFKKSFGQGHHGHH